jgi:putative FmdB family regulatory protein
MPIYEFYCSDCHMVFNFLSKSVDTRKRPNCPRCGKVRLDRQVSAFAMTGKAKGGEDADDLPIDESRMERAMASLASEADNIREDDPRQAARLMRKFSDMTGMHFGAGMEEAIRRMEAGEDPEAVEAEMGDLGEDEEPFVLPDAHGKAKGTSGPRRGAPGRDPVLYDL